MDTHSYSKEITKEYQTRTTTVIAEDNIEPNNKHIALVPLELSSVKDINVQQSLLDNIWARSKVYTSYIEYMSVDPRDTHQSQEEETVYRSRKQFGIFGITHNGHVVCNMQLQTSSFVLGDHFQMVADFSDIDIPCEQMIVSLFVEEYSPYLNGRIVKSDVINSLTINTRSVNKYPYSFSIPVIYPPTIQTQQVCVSWKLKFSFFFNAKWSQQATPEEATSYIFDPDEYLNQNLTKVDWTYDLLVRSSVNEKFGEVLGEKTEFEGREETTFVFGVFLTNKRVDHNQYIAEHQEQHKAVDALIG